MNYEGDIIEESLQNLGLLSQLNIKATRVEKVTGAHKTPWLKHWTLHTIEVTEDTIEDLAHQLSQILKPQYWYADFKNNKSHIIVFPDKIFKVDRNQPQEYKQVIEHGLGLLIPRHQLCFALNAKDWKL